MTSVLAHQPRFPEGGGPFEVTDAALSQAFYLQLTRGESLVFVLPPLERPVPVQVLVLDDARGRSLEPQASLRCGSITRSLQELDQPFYEPFSRLHHRYRVVDVVGPTESSCEVLVRDRSEQGGPIVFAVGDEERFGFGDILGLATLGGKLRAWQEGR